MPTRRNLCLRPALKNDATDWFGPSGWARITNGHASLPRQTALAGSTAGDIATAKFDCTAGLNYVGSVSVRFTTASVGQVNIDWYAAGVVYLSTSNGPGYDQQGGTTARLSTGVGLAPTNAVQGLINVAGIDGAAEVTAVLVEQTGTTGGAYFDGDSANSVWDGTNGASSSTETTTNPITLTGAVAAPVGRVVGVRESFGTLLGALLSPVGATGLIVTASYDDLLGRIRVSAQGMSATVTRAVLYSRPAGAARWTQVRGGKVGVVDGRFPRTVDDYEFTAGTTMYYQVVCLASPENAPDVVIQTETVSISNTLTQAWLKFVPAPHLNQKIRLTGWGDIERPARLAVYDVHARREPVVVTDVHGSRRVTIRLRTADVVEGEALDNALSQGTPIFLHTPVGTALPSLYAVIGDYSYRRPSQRSVVRHWSVPLIEVAPPPPSVLAAGTTWQSVLDQNTSWQAVLTRFATWLEVAA